MPEGRVDKPILHRGNVRHHHIVVRRGEEYIARNRHHQSFCLNTPQHLLHRASASCNVVRIDCLGESVVAVRIEPLAQFLALVLLVGCCAEALEFFAIGVGLRGVVSLRTPITEQCHTPRNSHTRQASLGRVGSKGLVCLDSHTLRLVEGDSPRRRAGTGGNQSYTLGKRWVGNSPLHTLEATNGTAHQQLYPLDAQPLSQLAVERHHIPHGYHGEVGAISPTRFGVDAHRRGCTIGRAEEVGADDKPPRRVEKLTLLNRIVPPLRHSAISRQRVTHPYNVVLCGRERTVGGIFHLHLGQHRPTLQHKWLFEYLFHSYVDRRPTTVDRLF